jgi:predicted dehydrogenase
MKNDPPISIALVGLVFGNHILEQLRNGPGSEYFNVSCICDLDDQLLQKTHKETGLPAVKNLEDLLTDSSVQVIGLFTGPRDRSELIRKCIQAGKDVITTKPFETSHSAAQDVLHEADRLGRKVMLNSPNISVPADVKWMEKQRDNYGLGRIVGGRAETWASYHEQADGSWYDFPESCPCAPVYRIGIYMINDFVHFMGKAEQVIALGSRLRTERPTPDNGQIGIIFENGAIANVFASFCVDDGVPYRDSLVLNYERGTLYRNMGPYGTAESIELTLVRGGVVQEQETVTSRSGGYDWEAMADYILGDIQASESMSQTIVEGIRIMELVQEDSSLIPFVPDQMSEQNLMRTTI